MNQRPDHEVIQAAVKALGRVAAATDAATEQAFNAARHEAVGRRRKAASTGWLLAAAAALVLAMGISLFYPRAEQETLLAQQPVADAELYQEMEFYLWLSEELESP